MLIAGFIFITGIIIGSFLNVCIYRLPRGGSLVSPQFSYCPLCEQRLYPWDLIPLISFLFLKGKCRYCGGKIPSCYFLIELLTGILFFLTYWYSGLSITLIPDLFFLSFLIVVAFIDLEHRIIPNKLNLFGALVGGVLNLLTGNLTMLNMFLGLLVAGGLMLIIAIFSKGGMGGGDVKLAGVLGIFLGWKLALLTLFLAFLLGGIVGIYLILLRKVDRKDTIPFGPFLALGALLAIIGGNKIVSWYLNTFL